MPAPLNRRIGVESTFLTAIWTLIGDYWPHAGGSVAVLTKISDPDTRDFDRNLMAR